jgi:hypothetical protein
MPGGKATFSNAGYGGVTADLPVNASLPLVISLYDENFPGSLTEKDRYVQGYIHTLLNRETSIFVPE